MSEIIKSNRYDVIRNLTEKYSLQLDKLIESLFDAETSYKEITKKICIFNKDYIIKKTGIGPIVTKFGKFHQITFEVDDKWKKYYVIAKANLNKQTMLPVFDRDQDIFLRIDSGCSSGQIFGDLTCECKDQLKLAIQLLSRQKQGLIINIPSQDGRGKGTEFKLATLYLQEQLGIDTTESFALLEKDSSLISLDCRTYEGVVAILKFLGLTRNLVIRTNNPHKINFLKSGGISARAEPLSIEPTKLTLHHLKAKNKILGHKSLGGLR